jgi:hypothetical protein
MIPSTSTGTVSSWITPSGTMLGSTPASTGCSTSGNESSITHLKIVINLTWPFCMKYFETDYLFTIQFLLAHPVKGCPIAFLLTPSTPSPPSNHLNMFK